VTLRSNIRRGLLALGVLLTAGFATSAAIAGHGPGHHPGRGHKSALYVSPTGKTGAADRNCHSAGYTSVQAAVDAAPSGGTVVVCRGTYTEDVIVSQPLKLLGNHGAVIQGSSTANGTCDQLGPGGPGTADCLAGITIKSSHVAVMGFTVTGAIGEGILATGSLAGGSIGDILIEGNRVVGNDTGGIPPSTISPYPQCVEFAQIPGDCGEGIHLMGVFDSAVSHNLVKGNSGGVLLTDEFGPTDHNVISHNIITKNLFDCGITAPGHNPFALDASGNPQPTVAGVYENVIAHNRITGNGTSGGGAGVLFANATAGSASYDNLVTHNYIAGNELSGVTLHAHTLAPGQFEDLSGNRIVHNTIGKNNTGGDPLDGSASDPSTTGVLVFSGTVPVTVTISHNRIRNDQYGIWLGVGGNVTATLQHNVFQHVATDVFTSP
jgi:Periplasmic copper-binding protein (NosD)